MINYPDFAREPYMTYCFNSCKLEFIKDELFITDFEWKRKYGVQFIHTEELPFVITLEEK